MNKGLTAAAFAGFALYLLARGKGEAVQQGGSSSSRVDSSLDKLVPSFRAKVLELLARMRARGLRPLVFETYRTPARAAELAKKGTGVALSQHSLGLAVDIIDAAKKWDAPPAFWNALHEEALALGLGRIKRRDAKGNLVWDYPHVQAMPGAYDAQMRALASTEKREAFLRERYV